MDRTPEVTDAKTLRVVANQVRLAIYEALTADGPATATQLADRLGGRVASLSYHLRTLARYGFVQESPELATDGRERVWRAVPGGLRWAQVGGSPGQREAQETAERVAIGRQLAHLRSWLSQRDRWPTEWRDASVNLDSLLHLTAQETAEMAAEVQGVLTKWSQRGKRAAVPEAISPGQAMRDETGTNDDGPDRSGPNRAKADAGGRAENGVPATQPAGADPAGASLTEAGSDVRTVMVLFHVFPHIVDADRHAE